MNMHDTYILNFLFFTLDGFLVCVLCIFLVSYRSEVICISVCLYICM